MTQVSRGDNSHHDVPSNLDLNACQVGCACPWMLNATLLFQTRIAQFLFHSITRHSNSQASRAAQLNSHDGLENSGRCFADACFCASTTLRPLLDQGCLLTGSFNPTAMIDCKKARTASCALAFTLAHSSHPSPLRQSCLWVENLTSTAIMGSRTVGDALL